MTPDPAVVVAGGGPAGAAAALTLARAGRGVVLVDEAPPAVVRIGEAIPPAARPLLRDLGVLDRVRSGGHLPCYGNVSVWGSDEPVVTDFLFNPHGHGWHVERARFDALLRDAARDAGADVRSGVRVDRAEYTPCGGWCVQLRGDSDQSEVRCGWVVDATGRRAAVARRHGAVRRQDDALVAFYGRFRPVGSGAPDSRTAVEAVPDGWWYTALVPSGERVAAFLTDADLADRPALLSPDGFVGRLGETRYVRTLLAPGYALTGRPRGAGAGSARLDRFSGPGWVAVGDAAVSFDPLSSQGILAALYTGHLAGRALHAALAGDAGPLDTYPLRVAGLYAAYQRDRGAYYAAERRWPDCPFWRRRLSGLERPTTTARAPQ